MKSKKTAKVTLEFSAIRGHLLAYPYRDPDRDCVCIYGDPEGLLSLAKMLTELAAVDQRSLPGLPWVMSEHIHLRPKRDLTKNSVECILGRLDKKSGEIIDAADILRKRPSKRPIVHTW